MSEDSWLPCVIEFNNYQGDWNRYLEAIYNRFCKDLVFHKVCFRGRTVAVRKTPETRGKGYGFWHCIQEGPKEQERTPDFERCKRIGWIRAIIENFRQPEIDYWTNKRGSELSHLLWYKEEYLVVLAERERKKDKRKYFLLKTAYCTTEERRRKNLRKERDSHKMADAAPEDGA